jgi:AcrR family transcriptional regulator
VTEVSEPAKRPYRSPRRREQAEQTRERVLDAAAALFRERGYERTAIAAIAASAGVADETVYGHFRNKRTLLGELVQRAVRGDDPRPVLEQEGSRLVAEATDQREQLRIFASDIGKRLERAAPLVAVVAAGARGEPELARLLERLHADRRRNLRGLVGALRANGPLRLGPVAVVDTVWALTSPELHQLLRTLRGWSPRRYADWLGDALAAQLLAAEEHLRGREVGRRG